MATKEEQAVYTVYTDKDQGDAAIVVEAIDILERRLKSRRQGSEQFSSPSHAADYARLVLAEREHEVFMGLFLNTQHQLIAAVELFRGTVNASSVYPREVLKEALKHNASAVIFAHNHPSGLTEPSTADKALTVRLKNALEMVDVTVLDHFVVGEGKPVSFAEHGLI